MQYALARVDEKTREDVYREYVTEALRYITENTAKRVGGAYLKKRYSDIINPKNRETQTGREIASDIIGKLSQKG